MPDKSEIPFESVSQPHDSLIKWSFGRNEVAAAHCQAYCPDSLVPIVDWQNLMSEPGSFVDPHLTESHTDLLFKAPLLVSESDHENEKTIYFYFLIEHITNPKADTVFRLAEYKLAIWRKLADQAPKGEPFQLPVILPFIIHQGSSWTMPIRISESLQLPENAPSELLEDIRDLELDMGSIPIIVPKGQPEKLKGHILGRVTLAIMNAARENRALEFLNDHGHMIAELLKEQDSMAWLHTLLRYMFQVDDQSWDQRQKVIQTIEDHSIQSEVMSIAEQLEAKGIEKGIERGIEKGIEKGIERGIEKIALKMIKAGKSDQEIADLTELSVDVIKQLRTEAE